MMDVLDSDRELTHEEQAENILDCVSETDVNEHLLAIGQIEATLALVNAVQSVGHVLNELLISYHAVEGLH